MIKDGYAFWSQIDSINTFGTLKELAEAATVNYVRMRNQRSDNRIPGSEDLYGLSKALNVSMEYLLTGETPSTYTPRTPQVKAIFDGILHATQAELDIIYRIIVKEEQSETKRIKNA